MIKLTDLPEVIQTELRNDPFIFVAANQKQVNISDMSAIVSKNDVMHVVDVLKRFDYKSGYHPFFLQHTDLFIQAQRLFLNLFGHDSDKIIYTYKKDFTSSIFLFTSSILIEKALKNDEIDINIENPLIVEYLKDKERREEKLGIEISNLTVSENKISARLPLGIFPVVGALNSIDSGWRTPNFNLIFGSQYNIDFDNTLSEKKSYQSEVFNQANQNEQNWLSNIDEFIFQRFSHGISLYSIDKFDFKFDSKICENYNPYSMDEFYSNSLIKVQETFTKTIVNFLLAINRGAYLPLEYEEFSAFMPHFYGYDRIVGSVKHYEDREKKKLKRIYDTSLEFAKKYNGLSCKHFIDYFLRDSIINFEELRQDPAKEILKAFENQPQIPLIIGAKKEMLSRFIKEGSPNLEYDQFLNGEGGQVEAKNRVYEYL
jgi:hypothetical protein